MLNSIFYCNFSLFFVYFTLHSNSLIYLVSGLLSTKLLENLSSYFFLCDQHLTPGVMYIPKLVRIRCPYLAVVYILAIPYQVENWLLCVSAEDLNSTQETEEMKLTEQPGEGETAKQTVAPCHQLTGRVGLQASFVPPIIPLFEEVNVACDT